MSKKQLDDSDQLELNLDLSLPQSKQNQGRLERVDSRTGFTRALFEKGANAEGVRDATDGMYEEAFELHTRELYEHHGSKRGNRDTLPEDIQDQMMLHEILNKRRVQKHLVESDAQNEVNQELTEVVKDQTQQNKGFFGGLFQ
ncbi:MAG: hypothetical protein ACRC8A_21300 [Microcoleaceae cyanobacterium]